MQPPPLERGAALARGALAHAGGARPFPCGLAQALVHLTTQCTLALLPLPSSTPSGARVGLGNVFLDAGDQDDEPLRLVVHGISFARHWDPRGRASDAAVLAADLADMVAAMTASDEGGDKPTSAVASLITATRLGRGRGVRAVSPEAPPPGALEVWQLQGHPYFAPPSASAWSKVVQEFVVRAARAGAGTAGA